MRRVLENVKKMTSNDVGITLIALVITIVVLLILVATSISMLSGENGILTQAQRAKEDTIIEQEKEFLNLAYSACTIDKYGEEITKDDIQRELNNVAGNGKTKVSKGTLGTLNVLYNDTKHLYWVSVKTGSITKNDIDYENDPIVDITSTYILRQSGSLSTYSVPEINMSHELYVPIEFNETVIDKNPKKISDGCYIDSNNNLCFLELNEKISNVELFDLACGYAFDSNGKIYMWGDNQYGRFGNGTTNYSDEIVCVNDYVESELYNKNIVFFSYDGGGYAAIDDNGNAYTWGITDYSKYNGILGDGTTNGSLIPKCITNVDVSPLYNKKIKEIHLGEHNAWAIDTDDKLYVWGVDYDGQIGDGNHGRGLKKCMPICISDIANSPLYNKKIKKVVLNFDGCCAIDENGNLYTWGTNWVVRLGINNTDNSSYNYLPSNASSLTDSPLYGKKIVNANISDYACYALDSYGKLYTWGHNFFGVTGTGSDEEIAMPVCLNEIEGSILYEKTIKLVYSEVGKMFAEDTNGNRYSWGEDISPIPQLVYNDEDIIKSIVFYNDCVEANYSAIAIKMYLMNNGEVYVDTELYNFS